MNLKKKIPHSFNPLSLVLLMFICSIFLSNCSVPKILKPSKVNTREQPVNALERARRNVEEGRGVSLKGAFGGGSRSTNYEFSTSNPMWRSSLEILDFLPLTTVDYSGGIIITDWYSDSASGKDSIKITVRFLSNEIRSDSIKIIVHNKKCQSIQNCQIIETNSKIKEELQRSILTKAMLFEKESKEKK
jgi:hypothetical protein